MLPKFPIPELGVALERPRKLLFWRRNPFEIADLCYTSLNECIYWYSQDATIPFDITFSMPPLDKRTRGYTPQQIKELQAAIGGDW